MSWTDERIALLKKMWKEGKSAAEIAKTLGKGVTRNAVIGKAHRMGLSGRPSPIKKQPPAKKETAAAPARGKEPVKDVKKSAASAGNNAKNNAVLAKESEELKKIEKELVQLGGGVSLLELTERMCKWPIGDPREADFSFCGRGIRVGTPYCPDHAAMAYQTSSRSRGHSHAVVHEKAAVVVEEVVDAPEPVEEEEEVA